LEGDGPILKVGGDADASTLLRVDIFFSVLRVGPTSVLRSVWSIGPCLVKKKIGVLTLAVLFLFDKYCPIIN